MGSKKCGLFIPRRSAVAQSSNEVDDDGREKQSLMPSGSPDDTRIDEKAAKDLDYIQQGPSVSFTGRGSNTRAHKHPEGRELHPPLEVTMTLTAKPEARLIQELGIAK